MGFAKHRAMEIAERGYDDTGDTAVCLDCLYDQALRDRLSPYIDVDRRCSFCKKAGAAEFEVLMNIIMATVSFFYGHANDEGVIFDEGDWVGAHIYDTHEVLDEICSYSVSDEVLEAVKSLAAPEAWADANFAVMRPDKAMRLGWQQFCEHVKHRSRFVFLSVEQKESFFPDQFNSAEMLARVAAVIDRLHLVRKVPTGTRFWRGRMVDKPRAFEGNAKSLGPTPPRKASTNRMSPAGISMFYGSDDLDTVVAEIAFHHNRPYATVAAFTVLRPLLIVDLSAIPDDPSIFDEEKLQTLYDLRFMRSFAKDLTKPVVPDGREHIEYVPTQVVTEYLRFLADYNVDGLVFESAQTGGRSCVLFIDAAGCADPTEVTPETVLQFEPSTLKTVRVIARPVIVDP